MTLPPSRLRTESTGVHCLLPLSVPFTPLPLSATPQSSHLPWQHAWLTVSDSDHTLLAVFLCICDDGSTDPQSRLWASPWWRLDRLFIDFIYIFLPKASKSIQGRQAASAQSQDGNTLSITNYSLSWPDAQHCARCYRRCHKRTPRLYLHRM